MNRILLQGAVYIDGQLVYEGLYPNISFSQGLVLYRLQADTDQQLSVMPDGPHVSLPFFHPYLLTTLHSLEEIRSNPRYRVAGPHVGSICRSGGYLYGDSLIRRITAVELLLTYSKHSVSVALQGAAGPVIPGNGHSAREQLAFDICFEIPISNLLQVAPDCGNTGVSALIEKLDAL